MAERVRVRCPCGLVMRVPTHVPPPACRRCGRPLVVPGAAAPGTVRRSAGSWFLTLATLLAAVTALLLLLFR